MTIQNIIRNTQILLILLCLAMKLGLFIKIKTNKSLYFKEGGYPLGWDDGKPEIISFQNSEYAYIDGKITFIKNLFGWAKQFKALPFCEDISGSNVRYKYSIVPSFGYENKNNNEFYLATMVYGKSGNDSP